MRDRTRPAHHSPSAAPLLSAVRLAKKISRAAAGARNRSERPDRKSTRVSLPLCHAVRLRGLWAKPKPTASDLFSTAELTQGWAWTHATRPTPRQVGAKTTESWREETVENLRWTVAVCARGIRKKRACLATRVGSMPGWPLSHELVRRFWVGPWSALGRGRTTAGSRVKTVTHCFATATREGERLGEHVQNLPNGGTLSVLFGSPTRLYSPCSVLSHVARPADTAAST